MQARYAESTGPTTPPRQAAPAKAPAAPKQKTSGKENGKASASRAGVAGSASSTIGSKPVELSFEAPSARSVTIAGTFNNWDDKKNPLQKDGKGWKASLPLGPGRYEYKFVVDGQWVCDPKAKETVQNDFGSSNAVLVV
jgi:1,4-alpha-glucan branching enzyme